MIGGMKLETENTNNIKNTLKASVMTALTFLCMVVGFITIFRLTIASENPSLVNPFEEVSSSCEEAGGVVIRGVNQHGDGYNRFAICVPYEALTCIDVE